MDPDRIPHNLGARLADEVIEDGWWLIATAVVIGVVFGLVAAAIKRLLT